MQCWCTCGVKTESTDAWRSSAIHSPRAAADVHLVLTAGSESLDAEIAWLTGTEEVEW